MTVSTAWRLFALGLVAALLGCVGREFVRPDDDSLKLGKSTYSELVGKLGSPTSETMVTRNGQTLKRVSYTHARSMGTSTGSDVSAIRVQALEFYNEVLVFHNFLSTWAEDSTNFDERKKDQIAKGQTTRTQLVALLGRPTGGYIYPATSSKSDEGVIYSYAEALRSKRGSGSNVNRKTLEVMFDESGVVKEVKFTLVEAQ
jgi:hypothetical protein